MATMISPAAAWADAYFGVGFTGVAVESIESLFGFTSDASLYGLNVAVGNTYQSGSLIWGYEGNVTLTNGKELRDNVGQVCSIGASGPYMCSHDATLRIVGVLGHQFGESVLYGKLGYGAAFGEFATDAFSKASGSVAGFTAAVGMKSPFNDSAFLFGEITYDGFNNSSNQPAGFSSDYKALGVTVGMQWSLK